MRADLAGYVVDGRFEHDVRTLHDGGKVKFEPPSKVQATAAFAERLPEAARLSLLALDRWVGEGSFPSLSNFHPDHTFGLDFAAREDLEVLDADFEKDLSGEVFAMASDGGGNVFCLLTNGRVAIWNHEEENIEDHTQFASLDIALWVLLRVEAVGDGKLDADELRPQLAALGEGGPAFYLKQMD